MFNFQRSIAALKVFSFILHGQPSFSGTARPIEKDPIHPSLEEVIVRVEHRVLMEVDNNILLIAGNP